ncbi:hypothetical protein PtA15_13A12 [Puccinia triticina]|uniref:Uncharacterized protein n=1 Tax=Puccinia triticina TaxID=208348 RepID=A0ABY7CZ59_9BASI|nr:uncharacterized protein PtA15_13A12 [Puccinia triticina]WAQ90614.1 hypothetical protein PtA15_13A12 [Puccinia triticina]
MTRISQAAKSQRRRRHREKREEEAEKRKPPKKNVKCHSKPIVIDSDSNDDDIEILEQRNHSNLVEQTSANANQTAVDVEQTTTNFERTSANIEQTSATDVEQTAANLIEPTTTDVEVEENAFGLEIVIATNSKGNEISAFQEAEIEARNQANDLVRCFDLAMENETSDEDSNTADDEEESAQYFWPIFSATLDDSNPSNSSRVNHESSNAGLVNRTS